MKCLIITSAGDDYMSAVLHDGFQELLGSDNVSVCKSIPGFYGVSNPTGRIGGQRYYRVLADHAYDLIVICTAYLREHDVKWPNEFMGMLSRDGKVSWVEGWDSASECHPPPFRVDGIFHREMMSGSDYPYGKVHSLGFAAPSRWFAGSDNADRPIDVFACFDYSADPSRWECLSKMFQTESRHRSIGASMGLGFDDYFPSLRRSKLALCPAGAAGCVALRAYEIASCGAIPIFVGHAGDRIRDPWFDEIHSWWCRDASEVPRAIDSLLGFDLVAMRGRLLEHAKQYHTTRYRAETVLKGVGL